MTHLNITNQPIFTNITLPLPYKTPLKNIHTTQYNTMTSEEHIFRSRHQGVPVPDLTLPEFVLQNAEPFHERLAFVEAETGKSYTYKEVVTNVKRFSNALRSLGLKKGNVVVVILPNVAEYAIVALGIMAAGGVFSGANPTAHSSEIKKQVDVAEAKLIVTSGPIFEKVKSLGLPVILLNQEQEQEQDPPIENAMNFTKLLEAADRVNQNQNQPKIDQNDLCALPFSSGTTGISKGVMLTHKNLVSNLCSTLFSVVPDMIGQVTTLGLIPFFHIYGITGICCATLRNKGKVVVMNRFELRAFLNGVIDHEVTFAPIVPPIILALVKNPVVNEFDLGKVKLRAVMTAAAPLAPDLLQAFQSKFPLVQVQEAYGLTEHSCITLTHGDPTKPNGTKKNSVGYILPNLEVKFIDPETGLSLPHNSPGEICVRSQCVMQGYFKNEEETKRTIDENGWLHTGDIGYIDDDGDIFIVDRIKELIKYKGFQVAPAELEGILLSHPSVEDAAVVPLPDEEAGEIPAACVVINPNSKETEEDLINYVSSNVSNYKKIRLLKFVTTIPKSPSGKIMRRLIKDNLIQTINSKN